MKNFTTKICGKKHSWCNVCKPNQVVTRPDKINEKITVEGKRLCRDCQKWIALEDFPAYQEEKYRKPICKFCVSLYMKEHRKNNLERIKLKQKEFTDNNRKFLREIKSNPCTDCGIQYPYYVMQFDHIPERGEKLFTISNKISRYSQKTILKEIEKCDLVCSNCHAIRTYIRRNKDGG